MKKILLTLLTGLALIGCNKKEFDLPEPLTEFDAYTSWNNFIGYSNHYIELRSGYARYYTDKDDKYGVKLLNAAGSGVYEKVDDSTLVFSDFLVDGTGVTEFTIERAEYEFRNEYLHVLTLLCRKDGELLTLELILQEE